MGGRLVPSDSPMYAPRPRAAFDRGAPPFGWGASVVLVPGAFGPCGALLPRDARSSGARDDPPSLMHVCGIAADATKAPVPVGRLALVADRRNPRAGTDRTSPTVGTSARRQPCQRGDGHRPRRRRSRADRTAFQRARPRDAVVMPPTRIRREGGFAGCETSIRGRPGGGDGRSAPTNLPRDAANGHRERRGLCKGAGVAAVQPARPNRRSSRGAPTARSGPPPGAGRPGGWAAG